nr:MAG TPA: hypothetical protein [Caudoviricetes sp.]
MIPLQLKLFPPGKSRFLSNTTFERRAFTPDRCRVRMKCGSMQIFFLICLKKYLKWQRRNKLIVLQWNRQPAIGRMRS